MSRNLTATTSTGALAHNLGRVRQAAPNAKVWGVVKANAYGHGLAAAMTGLADADGLALLEFDGAAALRDAGWTRPILMIEGAFEPADVARASSLGLSLVVHQPEQVTWMEALPGAAVPVFLKVNTGLNRLGVSPASVSAAHARLARCRSVSSVGLMTHFANSDVEGGALRPMQRFDEATRGLPGERSLANSAAVLTLAESHRDWVRPGIILYGATPFADRSAAACGLRPAMRLAGSLIAIQDLQPGDAVGYGGTFEAAVPMRIGIVNCGYADGYPRLAATGTPIVVGGVRTRTLGRVSMDMLAVDLDRIAHARIGTPVELWGSQVSVDEVAAAAGTIGYDLLCAVTSRVRREVVQELGDATT